MLNKLSVNTLLKSVIALLSAAVIAVMAAAAWNSWTRLAAVKQIAVVADASADLFTALHNLRVDRSYTTRDLKAEKPSALIASALKDVRDADLPAMKAALAKVDSVEFSGKQESVTQLSAAIAKLTTLHKDSMDALDKPLAQRPPGIADEYFKETGAMLKLFDTISDRLGQSVKRADSYVDQLLDIKQFAWMARDAGGDNAVIITNGISGLPVPQDILLTYAANDTKVTTTWKILEDSAADMTMPAYFTAALEKARQEYLGREFTELRWGLIKDIANHQNVQMKAGEWSKHSVTKLASLLGVAEAALKAGKDYAAEQRTQALWTLGGILGLLTLTIAIVTGMMFLVTRRVTVPLRKLAGVLRALTDDRIVDVPYADRSDEVGDIAKATEVFKQSIAEKVINLRVRAALDVVKSNVMVADADYNIIYMNGTLQEMLREAESELRKELPNFDAAKLVGVNMDVFHKNPLHQRKLMDMLTETRESKIAVGTQKFRHIATPVVDRHGNRAGVVVEWKNETAEKAIEAEIDGIVKAAVAGDFARRIPTEGKQEFMLNLANSVNALCDNTGAALGDLARVMASFADGDLSQRITAEYQGMFGQLKSDANAMADRIGATIAEIKASAREVTNASAEISTSTTDLSQRTEEQAASLEETSASMEEIAATVKKNADNAQAANSSAANTQQVADKGGQVVAQAVSAMARIEDSSRKISDIIGVIDEIARQTNLLALNAAVEAARAGEAGRGFAVVASEVRSLAQRSSQAAKDIKDLITNSNNQVKDGVDLVNKAGTALTDIVESIKQVAAIVAEIASASKEQATGIEQVNKALTQMDEVTQQNSALVEENAATAKTLEHQAFAMDERVGFFKLAAGSDVVPTGQAAAAVPMWQPPVARRARSG